MSKENNLKEKFKIALLSTANVIANDYNSKVSNKEKKTKNIDFLELESLNTRNDFIKYRAESDSGALKKKFSNTDIFKKNSPNNSICNSLYSLTEKIRYETLGSKMLKGIEKNFKDNYNQMIFFSISSHLFKNVTLKP